MNRSLFLLLGFHYCLSYLTTTWSEAHLIDAIFTEPTLEAGYHLIATIPTGASNLNVTQLRRTNNYLAIRLHDGRYLLNGNYSINWSGIYKAAGANLVYRRQTRRHLESLTAVGPLLEAIDVMLLYQEPNSGIVYRYHVSASEGSKKGKNNFRMMIADEAPASEPPSLPIERYRNKRKFAWVAPHPLSGCSKTCGGGVETLTFICVREHGQLQVPMKRCHGLEKPIVVPLRCNVTPCPPKWRMGIWSECSVTCGIGVRTRRNSECVQEINNSLTLRVADGACLSETKSPEINETCIMGECEDDKTVFNTQNSTNNVTQLWNIGKWSSCSASCGYGKKTRSVSCISSGRTCLNAEKPISDETCYAGDDCSDNGQYNTISEGRILKSHWLHTEWSKPCSAECSIGFETRKVICVSDEPDNYNAMKHNERQMQQRADSECLEEIRPESRRRCSGNISCGARWFTGPWSQCSVSCDVGEQTRDIVCVALLQGMLRSLQDANCPAIKPETKKPCRQRPCHSIWYTSFWSECTRSCGAGEQTREVKCLNPNGHLSDQDFYHCNETKRPESRRVCNDYPCTSSMEFKKVENWTRSRYIEKSAEVVKGITGYENCKDNMSNCALVTQARLCIYPFYRAICCASCFQSKHEDTERNLRQIALG